MEQVVRSVFFVVFVVAMPSTVANPTLLGKLPLGKIRPISCSSSRTGETGVCMFVQNCVQAKGTPLDICRDGVYIGCCCRLPQSGLSESLSNDIPTGPAWSWFPNAPSSPRPGFGGASMVTSVVTSVDIEENSRTENNVVTTKRTSSVGIANSDRTTSSDSQLFSAISQVLLSEDNNAINSDSSYQLTTTNRRKVTTPSPPQTIPSSASTDNNHSSNKVSTVLVSLVSRRPTKPTTINWSMVVEHGVGTSSTSTPSTSNEILQEEAWTPKTTYLPTTIASTANAGTSHTKPMRPVPIQTTSSTAVTPPKKRPGIVATTQTTIKKSTVTKPTSPSPTPTTSSTTLTDSTTELNFAEADFREICGQTFHTNVPVARIVGGDKSQFGKWPWQVSLRQKKRNVFQHKCGAALLNENWAITAAHCVDNVPVEQLQVRIGDFDIVSNKEPLPHVDRQVQIIAKHPDFNARNFENDLALVRFYEPVHLQKNIIPICIPEDDNSFVNDTAYVTGWGRLYEDGPLPEKLHEAQIPIISNKECEQLYRRAGYIEAIPDIFICAGRPGGGVDSCEGDSGGPMVVRTENKRWVLAGIISWGIGCAEPNQPGVYTRITKFSDWINAILVF